MVKQRTSGSHNMISTVEPWASRSARAFQGMIVFGFLMIVGCSPLEPLAEPELSDLQLTVDTLKTTIRDAQRTIVDLRAELEARRQELADVQIARAQLEGRVREAERRLVEARQVIDLQREELAGSRSERDRVTRSGAALHHELKQLQQQLAKLSGLPDQARGPRTTPASRPSRKRPAAMAAQERDQSGRPASPAVHVSEGPSQAAPLSAASDRILVKPGDTLWSIAQRYRLPVKRLMAMNQLPNTHIEAGQVLWLSDPSAAHEGGAGSAQ